MCQKKLTWLVVSLFVILSLVFTLAGCGGNKKSTPTPADQMQPPAEQQTGPFESAQIMQISADYLTSERGKIPTVSAQEIYEKVITGGDSGYFLVSLQKPEDYAKGHVKGAINIPYSQVAKEENLQKLPKDKKIVLICYTGHTASYTAMFLNQLGYEAYAMKFGMMGWNSNSAGMGTVKAFTKSPNYLVDNTAAAAQAANEIPAVNTGKASLKDILLAATDNYVSSERGKMPTVSAQEIYEKAVTGGDSGYFLVSLQKPEDYAKGHVKGAVNIPYSQVAKEENLQKLPKDKKIVLICYTGHTASYTSMFLNQLGYEAYAMKFGMMGWNSNSAGMGTVKAFTKSPEYPVIAGSNP